MFLTIRKTILFIFLFLFTIKTNAKIIIYLAPKNNLKCSAYRVQVREAGTHWQPVDVYHASVVDVGSGLNIIKKTSFAYFDCTGTVEVTVMADSALVKKVRIRPLAYNIKPIIHGNSVTFFMKPSETVSIEINNDIFQNLQLFAGAVSTAKFSASDTSIIYFGPGIHHIGRMRLPSNKTVYIAGGAIVHGGFLLDHVNNVRICGRGILTQLNPELATGKVKTNRDRSKEARDDEITINYSTNVQIAGLIVIPHHYSIMIGQSKNVSVSDFKSFSSEGNADGIDIFSSTNISLDHIFMRNSDDCIAIYGHRWDYYGNTSSVNVTNAVLWADIAHPVLIGTHGDTPHPDTLKDIKFNNIQILDQHENQIDYQGCLSLDAGDSNLISNVSFSNVNIEDIRKGQLFNIRVMFNHKYNTSPGRGIENVLFKNVSYVGTRANLSIIAGYDDSRPIRNIRFEDLKINGKFITDTMKDKPAFYKTGDMANIFIGEHVYGVSFIKTVNDD